MYQLRHTFSPLGLGSPMSGTTRTLIAGIGSDFGDDRLGFDVVERLADSLPRCAVKAFRSPLDLLDHLSDFEVLHLVDACRGADSSGTVLRFEWPSAMLKSVRFGGTHDFDLISTLRLAESLRLLPRTVTIWSIATEEPNKEIRLNPNRSSASPPSTERLVDLLKSEVQRSRVAEQAENHA